MAKLALSSLHRKCEAVNMLGVSGAANGGYTRVQDQSFQANAKKDISNYVSLKQLYLSEKDNRPSLYYT